MASLRVVYFAWVRERIGVPSETITFDGGTVSDLIDLLKARDERYSFVFSDPKPIRVAVDQVLCDFDRSLSGAKEIAFFPPMTGG
jgi:molybdopterin synthase sulfur carrier subunit